MNKRWKETAAPTIETLENRLLFNAGNLDASFGVGDVIVGDSTREPLAVVVQSDGKIVVVGKAYDKPFDSNLPANQQTRKSDLWIARFKANGSLDTSFNKTGEAIIDDGSDNDAASKVALQSNVKIVILADQHRLYRFKTSGGLDKTFGTNGIMTTNFAGEYSQGELIDGSDDILRDIALTQDGKILAVGMCDHQLTIARYPS
jgi:uncharacterized delta-60 repeat protein